MQANALAFAALLGGLAAGAVVVVYLLARWLPAGALPGAGRHQQLERLERLERLAALGRLAAAVAHEVRNPLATIRGFLQLHEDRLDPEVHGLLLAELDRMDALTAEFLRLSRPGAGTVVPVATAELLAGARWLGELLAAGTGGRLAVGASAALPPAAGDPERLRQVLLNLLKNAFEADPGGTVTLEAGSDGPWVWLSVTDHGPGVPPALRRQIFDPFFTTKPGGTGLGLTVSQQILQALGGGLEIQDPPGGGARFVLRLPVAGKPEGGSGVGTGPFTDVRAI